MRTAPLFLAAAVALAPALSLAADAEPTGPVVVPSDRGLVTTLPDGVTITFEAGTTARWEAAGKLASETAKWTRGFHLEVTDGELDVAIPPGPKGKNAFLVTTRAGTLTDWRGRMHVSVHGDTTAVSVYEGSLVVGSNKQSFPVVDNAAVVLHKGGEADKGLAIPGVATWDTSAGPPSFAVVPQGAPAGVGVAWARVPGAASYRVLLASDAGMTQIVARASVGDPRFTAPEPGPGVRFWAQVRAVGADGLVGEWSAPRAMRVVRYTLPQGAFVARDGVIVLPPGSVLALSDIDGVQVAYENVRPGPAAAAAPVLYWSSATGPVRLPDDDTPVRIVHLKDASIGAEGRIAVGKRELRADVDVQPKVAHAVDPIDVRAVVWDPTGRVDGSSEAVSIQALADLDPIQIPWQHVGNVWTARIGPRRDRGPSVVRVVVTDSLGREIGRGFVEIIAASASSR
jgi:FecR protein